MYCIMLNIYYCGTCKKCLPKENYNQCNLCQNLLQGKCECGCAICDLCYDYELTKCYSFKTGELSNGKNECLYLTICLKCNTMLNSPFTVNKQQQIKDCMKKTYPNFKLEKSSSKCCMC